MKENLQIFDWELNDDELTKIENIPQRRGFSGHWFVHPNGPYKSVEELWDDDAWISIAVNPKLEKLQIIGIAKREPVTNFV